MSARPNKTLALQAIIDPNSNFSFIRTAQQNASSVQEIYQLYQY